MADVLSVAVVGAGAAGLSAAWQLARRGARVVVYDGRTWAGGLLRTVQLADASVDVGVQLLASSYTAALELAEQTGAQLRGSPGRDALWRKGRPQPITYGSVTSMVASGALPTSLKLKLGARYLAFLNSSARGLDANDLARTGGAAHDTESIAAWGGRELGEDFVELLGYPALAAYYGALPEETSAAVYHGLARMGMDVSVFAAESGFGALAAAVQRAIEQRGGRFEFGKAVSSVTPAATGVLVDGDAFDAVVIATPANRAGALLASFDAPPQLRAFVDAVRVRPALTVSFRIDRAFPGDYFGLSFPRVGEHGDRIAAVCIQSRKLPTLVHDGDALVALPAPAVVPGLLDTGDDVVTERMLRALDAAIPGVAGRVVATHVQRFDDAYTLFEPGSIRRLAAFDAEWLPANVALAGAWLQAPTVEGAVRSGVAAASRLLRRAGGRRDDVRQ